MTTDHVVVFSNIAGRAIVIVGATNKTVLEGIGAEIGSVLHVAVTKQDIAVLIGAAGCSI
jgi:hypothetical protein